MTPLNDMQLRKQLFEKLDLGEHARDVQQLFDLVPRMFTKTTESAYTQPMVLGGFDEQPESIELVRIIDLNAQETPVACGSMVHYVWKPQRGGAQITSIDGLTPSPSTKYRFTFRLTFPARQQGVI